MLLLTNTPDVASLLQEYATTRGCSKRGFVELDVIKVVILIVIISSIVVEEIVSVFLLLHVLLRASLVDSAGKQRNVRKQPESQMKGIKATLGRKLKQRH